ncbi:peptide-methionine (S)-S-oxide reductase MsrA [Solemya velum gill symbiont]|uniref:Peptide methionine sulfoxide reductase MsrA n=2 Tax=Solemya velum gill symbiont TaxID=2340 RepID=A0A1T2CUR9_SOVGS|nr:peptide-methionine (S)-S-oxide reductase MsrA [Solemya velum gill symbiont]OOY35552.1 peptide-methionine (S)-S-oxide reductase [Solemya velum gill symbiont]OOY38491.1 peptide-methionine (S)-S-oxide reductase [Solemya velum gill symbiont]OOY45110.1 peptide-methionine (S)-S-oxide reductase [Solemya velum gill symbiont]OOY48871.1 peptide-methionine (S)-S-oxide reductase [Solemya velum gill symbiont]OOY50372.1 peptide-methionine (S)-S-oxide reductase [Solemya velum gill symbiont]
MSKQIATLGGGCFWCLEAVFTRIDGVISVKLGYAGGHTPNPSYEQVCDETTGHAEVVQVEFDSDVIDYATLLEVFFAIHDPTSLNRQGADIGTRYRSVILYADEDQQRIAAKKIGALEASGVWKRPIVTEAVQLEEFYDAEGYHQDYYDNHQQQPYCQVVIAPKLAKLKGFRLKT